MQSASSPENTRYKRTRGTCIAIIPTRRECGLAPRAMIRRRLALTACGQDAYVQNDPLQTGDFSYGGIILFRIREYGHFQN